MSRREAPLDTNPRRHNRTPFLHAVYRYLSRWLANPASQASLGRILQTLVAVTLALVIGMVLILVIGENPLQAYYALLKGAVGGVPALARTLRMASPLILTGLAVMVAFRAGMINLGIEGSLYLGALAAALTGVYLHGLPFLIHLPLALLTGAAIGGLWAFVPGYLKARWDVDEIVATLMLNYVAILLVDYLVLAYFMDPVIGTTSDRPATRPILETAHLPLLSEEYGLSIGILIGLVLAAGFAWLYARSVWGFEADMTGLNQRFAHFGGVNTPRVALSAMVASGLLGGLAGATESLGVFGRYVAGFSTGLGFDGVTVALMGQLTPLGTLLAALFFGALKNGGSAMEVMVNVPRDIILVIQGLILAIVTAQRLFASLHPTVQKSGEEP